MNITDVEVCVICVLYRDCHGGCICMGYMQFSSTCVLCSEGGLACPNTIKFVCGIKVSDFRNRTAR